MADLFKFVQAQNFSLAGAGAISGATSITLKSLVGIDGALLTMTDFGAIGFGTLEPGNGTQEEQISFTGITQNANGTATLTGVSTVLFVSPYTATSGLAKTHPGSSIFIISNTSGFYDRLAGKADDETITGLWNFPSGANNPTIGTVYVAPTTDLQIATKKYVDDVAIAGAPKATDTVYGIVKLSVAAVAPTIPIAVGDNDPRVSPVSLASVTANEVAALAGTGTPNGTTGKYVTNDDTSATSAANKVYRMTAGGKLDATLLLGNLPALNGSALTNLPTLKVTSGVGSHANGAGNITIAHGLGVVPKFFKITYWQQETANGAQHQMGVGTYDGTTNRNLNGSTVTNAAGETTTSSWAINPQIAFSTSGQLAATWDSTNVTLTVTTDPGVTFTYIWECYGIV